MDPRRWRKLEHLYHAAQEIGQERRVAFLEAACAGDGALRDEIESLLAQEKDAKRFMEAPAVEFAARAIAKDRVRSSANAVAPIAGMTFSQYRILERVGEGGMGVVYTAEDTRLGRLVALKFLKPAGADSSRRFGLESQVLARLQHPCIAQIYETGAADAGFGLQPYFAMEFIRGVPLGKYAESHRLSIRQRLELMAMVCDGVEHAHQRGIIHRDLKPGNILVDQSGQPKILDFGVARVTDSDRQATRQTVVGQLIGTLAYMSPEQVTGDPRALDVRSDVYALGVILYELLFNRLPYELSPQLHEAVRTIREEDPTKPGSIGPAYRGDVETIVLKALEKDKARRYSSAALLAADIRRYLADQPIAARPASAGYRARKFARRHKVLLTATALTFAVLLSAVVVSARQAVLARRSEQRAQAVVDFLRNDLLAQSSAVNQSGPNLKPDPDLKVRTALNRAADRIGRRFAQHPELEASIRDTIGLAYKDLGLYPEAYQQLKIALALARSSWGPENPVTLRVTRDLGDTAFQQARYSEAEALFSRNLDVERRVLGPNHPDTLNSMEGLSDVFSSTGRHRQAEALSLRIWEVRRKALGPAHPDTLRAANDLAIDWKNEGRYAEAETILSQTLEAMRRVLGREHPYTLKALHNLGVTYELQGDNKRAEELYKEAVEAKTRVLGPEHASTLFSMQNLANVYLSQHRFEQAESLQSRTLEIRRRVLGIEHHDTLETMSFLAQVYTARGDYAQSETLSRQTSALMRRVLGAEHPLTLASMQNLGAVLAAQGDYDQAVALYTQSLAVWTRVSGPEHPGTLEALAGLASVYQRRGRQSLAVTSAEQALSGRRHALGSEHPDTMSSATDLAFAYVSQGKFTQSEPLAREALEFNRKKQPEDWQRSWAECLLGASLAGQKKYAEAEPLLLEGYQAMVARKVRIAVPDWYRLDRAREWLFQLYQVWGKPAKAAEWRKK